MIIKNLKGIKTRKVVVKNLKEHFAQMMNDAVYCKNIIDNGPAGCPKQCVVYYGELIDDETSKKLKTIMAVKLYVPGMRFEHCEGDVEVYVGADLVLAERVIDFVEAEYNRCIVEVAK